jgi:hypothetical protein
VYKTLIESSTHLVKLFAAVGNTELSKKMAPYTTEHKVLLIKTFWTFGGSSVAVERQHCRKSSVRVAPSTDTVYRIIKQSEETESVCDKRMKDVNSSVLRLYKVRDFRGHHMENVLV